MIPLLPRRFISAGRTRVASRVTGPKTVDVSRQNGSTTRTVITTATLPAS